MEWQSNLLPRKQKADRAKHKKTGETKQPIGKQHADNQSEEGKSLRGGKSEKEEETGKKNRVT